MHVEPIVENVSFMINHSTENHKKVIFKAKISDFEPFIKHDGITLNHYFLWQNDVRDMNFQGYKFGSNLFFEKFRFLCGLNLAAKAQRPRFLKMRNSSLSTSPGVICKDFEFKFFLLNRPICEL